MAKICHRIMSPMLCCLCHGGLFVGWLVCKQNNTKTAERIPMKLEWRIGLRSELSPLPFGTGLVEGTDPGILLNMFNIFINFSENNAWIFMRNINGL